MKVAVVSYLLGGPGWCTDWMNLCEKHSIEYREFPSFDPDFIDNLMAYKPDRVLWQSTNIPHKKIKDETQRQFLEMTKLRIIPNWWTHYLYDHKIRQSYLFKLCGIPHPETKVFFEKTYALEYIEKAEYPFIVKADGGAGGRSFRFIDTKKEALRRVNDAFGGKGRLTGRESEKNILYVQEYISHVDMWRIGVFKNKVGFGFIQKRDPKTKVASWRSEKVYPEVPVELLDMVLKINERMKWDWSMIDLIWSEKYKKYLVLEFTDTCGIGGPVGRGLTYYRKGGYWKPKNENPAPQEIIFNLFVLEDIQ